MADLAEARRDTEFASSQARVLMQELDRLLGTLRNEVSIRALGTREQLERARCEVVIPIRDRVQATVEMHGKAMDRIDSTLDQVLGRLVVVAEKVCATY
mmetsp:Transcript_11329/g.22926  ORF Transcript_11329/g.22926 Transcript_11329/m.22926 type:complete len:99 (-) Transcript_11329:2680-2976(-)